MSEGQNLPSSSQALIALEAPSSSPHHRPTRRIAAFVAHVIATARHAPQTRERNCADPAEVIAAYKATIAKIHALNAHSLIVQ